MEQLQYIFSNKKVQYYLDESLANLSKYANPDRTILLVDDKVGQLHQDKLKGWRKIIIPGTEENKSMACFQHVVDELMRMEANRKTLLIGIGGGVVTDLTGFVGSVYMRGIAYAFVPTTLLAQVDAAVGGKNGVNYDRYKNILGVIRQPEFLLFDYSLLDTLEPVDLHNGFAEVIKYACIYDEDFFDFLEKKKDGALAKDPKVIDYVVRRSVEIKSEIVQKDEFESGIRRLLNFGHTIGHAVEKIERIPHGQAVAIGMVAATNFSEQLSGLSHEASQKIKQLIEAYHLPSSHLQSDSRQIEQLFRMDKKREKNFIHFILLEKIGRSVIKPIKLTQLSTLL